MKKEEYQSYLSQNFKRSPRKSLESLVFSICDIIHDSGQRITIRLVRQHMGSGSHSTISKYVGLWRAQKFSRAREKAVEDFLSMEAFDQKAVLAKYKERNDELLEAGEEVGCFDFFDDASESFLNESNFDVVEDSISF